jgi:hypothetical protein
MGADEYDFICLCIDRCSDGFFTFWVLYRGYACKYVLLFIPWVCAFSLALRVTVVHIMVPAKLTTVAGTRYSCLPTSKHCYG